MRLHRERLKIKVCSSCIRPKRVSDFYGNDHYCKSCRLEYNAEWIVSRSHKDIRGKAQELIKLLKTRLPGECEFIYRPREVNIRYRGVRCIYPNIQQKQIRLQITHRGWTPGIIIDPDTDLNAPEFLSEAFGRFETIRQQIDSQLDAGTVSRKRVV